MLRSDALGFDGELLCADFNLRRVSRYRLSPSGSSFSAEMDILMESDQKDYTLLRRMIKKMSAPEHDLSGNAHA